MRNHKVIHGVTGSVCVGRMKTYIFDAKTKWLGNRQKKGAQKELLSINS
jgi:hypothetical protein